MTKLEITITVHNVCQSKLIEYLYQKRYGF